MVLIGTGLMTLAVAVVYMAPTLVAIHRKAGSIGWILAFNLLGFTVIFWAVAWVLALREPPQPPVRVQVYNSPPPLPPSWRDPVLRGDADPPGRDREDTLPDGTEGPEDWPPPYIR
jgi:T4 superinfection immunity protein